MQVIPAGRDFILRLDPGDDIFDAVTSFVQTNDIPLATVSGIGAINRCEIGRYLLSEKRYETNEYTGEFEVLAVNGNISTMDGKPYVHLHLAFADEHMVMHGGHLNAATVSLTAEIFIRRMDGGVNRAVDEATGINRIVPR